MKRTIHPLTRRGFLKGSAAVGAAIGTVHLLSGCTNTNKQTNSDPVVVDQQSGNNVLENYEYDETDYTPTSSYTLSLGSVLRPGEGTWVPCITAGAKASPMVTASAFNIDNGNQQVVVPAPITHGSNYEIFDARCSDDAYAWVELNLISHDWKLYGQSFSDGELTGSPSTLWEADSNWDPPALAVSRSKVIWQVQPATSGNQSRSSSNCYLWKTGDSQAQNVVESQGRFGCAPTISDGVVTLVPRVNNDKGAFYGIVAYSLGDDLNTQIDQLVLPQSVRPMSVTRIGDEFAFSIEASYEEGSLLSRMGTYIGHGNGPFIVINREPMAGVAGKDHSYIVKARTSYYVIDTDNQRYRVISAVNRALDFGEYPACVGHCDTFVTFSTVKDPSTGYPASVSVRTFHL